jgi:hypothetical protein
MNGYVKEDLIVIQACIQFSVEMYKKNGGSSSTSSFYTLKNVVFAKDIMNNKKKDLIFKHKHGAFDELKHKYYQPDGDYEYNTKKRMYITIRYYVNDKMVDLYDELKVKTSKYGFGSEKFENKCQVKTYWTSEWDDKERTYESAHGNDVLSHLIVTI